ncbi:hypothetical protein ACF1BS_04280 [Streptomyces sp. NPDC014748]|uniref:hypothetical protein n=1 Tax=Streptomyces sp. NPDC014748 TaxID=3364905 RepID=UPI0036FDB240
MTDQPRRLVCGNDPRAELTDGDREAVAEFRAYLSRRAALRDRIAEALREADTYAQLERRDDRERFAAAVLAVLLGADETQPDVSSTPRVLSALHRSAEEDVARVIELYEQWVKAGPPPLGTSMSRWWDVRLAELHNTIRPSAGRQLQDGPRQADVEESPHDAVRRIARRLAAVERLCSGRPGYHTITVEELLTAMGDADEAWQLPVGFRREQFVTVDCAECGAPFAQEEEGYTVCFSSVEEATKEVKGAGWTVLSDGRAVCPSDELDHPALRASAGAAR